MIKPSSCNYVELLVFQFCSESYNYIKARRDKCFESCQDEPVPVKLMKSSQALDSNGFQNVAVKGYNGLGHYTIPEEMDEVCAWLTSKLGLEGSSFLI
ncbi:hypothetical protein LWI29_010975 [Acer saccharum]|uniref:Phospholipase/carboxylesterase/thioesterase domain-containing protein n=1 Tax=Acer saccharum TaxID=4024 RepID=A0AA39RJ17_ACESA|nr:hypothetical protein LWI29_010975 [Acer saccharum]